MTLSAWLPRLRLLLVMALVGLAWLAPTWPMARKLPRLLLVVDITQSMNVEDYAIAGLPKDRLSMVKTSLLKLLPDLPCQSEIGLALFTNKDTFLLFEPLPLCEHYAELSEAINRIDWRMAWAADSHVARGLFKSLRELGAQDAPPALVFFTDGLQTPSRARTPPFLLEANKVPGLIIGVGQTEASPVPEYNQQGEKIGYWHRHEAESLPGKPPGSPVLYQSPMDELALQTLAEKTGLYYHHLQGPEPLQQVLTTPALLHTQTVPVSLVPWLAGLALIIWLAPLLPICVLKHRISIWTILPARR
ncbi:MAG: vWA domain-containing protein [Methylococcales bacterium]|nr:vWA domain-containing protein [Methylococcales bacterium]